MKGITCNIPETDLEELADDRELQSSTCGVLLVLLYYTVSGKNGPLSMSK